MSVTAVVTFRALQLANEHRNAYGLRYNDFQRYRKHCANRTHRLRSTLKMTHGKGRNFQKLPTLTKDTVKDGHLQLLLFETERAWAYAQELSADSLRPSNEDRAGALRHSATGRFRRAVNWSTQLLSHCQELYIHGRFSAENLIEATIYTIIVNGRFLRYRDEFDDALVQLSIARSLLDSLAGAATTSRDQALAVLFADEIGPEIRHCAHEMGHPKAYDIDGIVAQLTPTQKNAIVEEYDGLLAKLKSQLQASSLGESKKKLQGIVWEGQPVPVRNPELVDVLLKVQDGEARLAEAQSQAFSGSKGGVRSKKGIAAYDATLLALSDAEEVARKLTEAQQLTATSNPSVSAGRDIHFVYAYIVYELLRYRTQRDLLLISALLASQPEGKQNPKSATINKSDPVDGRLYPAVVKLLDTVLQSLNQMRTLSVVDDNPDLASAIDARISLTKARRCAYLARCYDSVKRYAEALTLLQHASIHTRETASHLSLSNMDNIANAHSEFFPVSTDDIKELDQTIALDSTRCKRDWLAYNGGSVANSSKNYKKPLFFNIALNYVELDMDRLLERAGKARVAPPPVAAPKAQRLESPAEKRAAAPKAKAEETRPETPQPAAPAKGGLSSLLGGWWGRS
ncbi:hypothetical protein FA13DRAFT_1748786 [Coprinellus micaceus]|uniref:Signal recognition particle subunit SRP68 n=1 Tax=Coprinellus micaceus TaxID=71717 RepID=A0A4Y7RQ28_COPMI|nr:hypothetical protein FA13DRAFT_1748786 [Coprinellus micaceus]